MNTFNWRLPVSVHFGVGSADEASRLLDGRPTLVLTFEGARRHEALERWSRQVCDGLLDWVEVPDGLSTMALGRAMASRVWPVLRSHPDAIVVGVGGGSVMDIAKWIRFRPQEHDDPHALDELLESSALPANWARHTLWLLPTTAGTGSEVTRWSTLWDTDVQPPVKRSFDQPYAYAEEAFVDPRLAMSAPLSVVRDSALDALGHALESIWNRHRNPMSLALAEQAAARVFQHLPRALSDPQAPAPREELALAALEAGVAFSQTRTAVAHALSYPLTVERGVPHGAAVALWLPLAWRMAQGEHPQVDASLAKALGAPAQDGAALLEDWLQDVGLTWTLSGLGIEDVESRVRQALDHPRGRNFEGRWRDAEV